jgi:hypothetical protein
MSFPVQVRITSRFGEAITFPAISSMADNQRFTGPAQFTTFSPLAPVPERPLRPVYREGLTFVPGDQWSAMPYGGASFTATAPTLPYRGERCARLGGLGNFGGVVFSGYPEFPRPEFGVLKLAVRAGTALPADRVGLIPYGRAASTPAQINGQLVHFPPLSPAWQVIEIPLETSTPAVIWGFSIVGRIGGALPDIWLDEVSFERR